MLGTAIAAIAIAAAAPRGQAAVAVDNAANTAIATCEHWILDPSSWADGVDQFAKKGSLAARGLTAESGVPDIALPPPNARIGMHHWRVPIGKGGIYVTASDQVPLCHVVGGGPFDLQPGVTALQASPGLLERWKQISQETRDDLLITTYVSLQDPKLSLVLSRAAKSGLRTDRAQLIATVFYNTGQ